VARDRRPVLHVGPGGQVSFVTQLADLLEAGLLTLLLVPGG
jgi:hypothetical protein